MTDKIDYNEVPDGCGCAEIAEFMEQKRQEREERRREKEDSQE